MLFAFLFKFTFHSIVESSQTREILLIELLYDYIELEKSNGYRNKFEK